MYSNRPQAKDVVLQLIRNGANPHKSTEKEGETAFKMAEMLAMYDNDFIKEMEKAWEEFQSGGKKHQKFAAENKISHDGEGVAEELVEM